MLIPMPVDDPLPMAWLDLNDLGAAERLVRLSRGELLWVRELGWAAYDGRRWSVERGQDRATELAHDVARHLDREAKALADAIADAGDSETRLQEIIGWPVSLALVQQRMIDLRKYAVKAGDASRTAGMLAQARAMLSRGVDEFDRDPLALNLLSGTLRFVEEDAGRWSVSARPHDPRDMLMQLADVDHDPEADCPEWRKRLALIQPAKDQRALLQAVYGYCLTGLTSEQKWFVFQGRGGDGKSMTNTVIGGILGDYYRHSDVKTWLKGAQKSGSDHSSDVARLKGDIRMVSFDEPPRNSTWDSSRLKQWTGGTMTARAMRQEEVDFHPRGKLIGEVNPLPAVESDDDGFWRRARLVPWPYQFDKEGAAAEAWDVVLGRLEAERSGILNWMIKGCLWWLQHRRLPASAAATEALDEYRRSASPFGEWLLDRADTSDRGALTAASVLYEDFKAFCEAQGVDPVPKQATFGRGLRDRQIAKVKDGRGNIMRRGIRLKPTATALETGAGAGADGGTDGAAEPRRALDWGEDDDAPF